MYFPQHKGLVTGIVLCGFGLGSFVFDLISTAVVNPDGESPKEGTNIYSDKVSQRVPEMIQVLTICWACLSLIGIALFIPYKEEPEDTLSGELESFVYQTSTSMITNTQNLEGEKGKSPLQEYQLEE